MSIQIFTTGGTFDKVYYDALSEFSIGEPMAIPLLQDANVNFTYQVESLLKKDSLEFTDQDRNMLAERIRKASAEKILVIHGTDTMTLSAETLGNLDNKTVVFTGAMQPARMHNSDAPFNLGFALGILQCLPSGVYLAMNGEVFPVGKVQKNRAASRFETK